MRYLVGFAGFGLMVIGGFCALNGIMTNAIAGLEGYLGLIVAALGVIAIGIAAVDDGNRQSVRRLEIWLEDNKPKTETDEIVADLRAKKTSMDTGTVIGVIFFVIVAIMGAAHFIHFTH